VLLPQVLNALGPHGQETYIDATFGAGGYSEAILTAAPAARVLAIDRDPSAIAAGRSIVDRFQGRLQLVEGRFGALDAIAERAGYMPADGVVLDIGMSSMQLDEPERGFSFQGDGPLDMRMGSEGQSAADFVNTADEGEIADVLFHYGEEPRSRRVARAIVAARPITRTGQLADLVRKALGHHAGMKKDPATRTFQALRIHINDELSELEGGLEAAEQVLKPGGRLAVVTFHSLEDRIVKRFLKSRSGAQPAGSRHLPAANQAAAPAPTFESVARPVRAGAAELKANPRARSATLRAARRTAAPARAGQAEGAFA
jgi:16S rRNA (cytosine1402-N4)-methyltransferase